MLINNKGAIFGTIITTRCGAQRRTNLKFLDRNTAVRSARSKGTGFLYVTGPSSGVTRLMTLQFRPGGGGRGGDQPSGLGTLIYEAGRVRKEGEDWFEPVLNLLAPELFFF